MKLGRNDLCWCGSQNKYKKCHAEFDSRIEFYKAHGQPSAQEEIMVLVTSDGYEVLAH